MDTRDDDEFLRLVLEHRRRLYGYIFSRMPNRADAEDLLQETLMLASRKFAEFERGTDFLAWTRRIAFLKIKDFQRRFARSPVVFNELLLERLEETTDKLQPELDAQYDALAYCLEKLPKRERRMIEARYADDGGVDRAAEVSGRSKVAAYKALHRVRELLLACVERRLAGV